MYLPDIENRRWYYPTRICSRCSFAVMRKEKLAVYSYNYNLKVTTRTANKCECEICKTARLTLQIHRACKRGRPSTMGSIKKARVLKHCADCFSEIGKAHHCTATTRRDNVLKLLQGNNCKTGESAVAEYLRIHGKETDGSVLLSNLRGHPTNCILNPEFVRKKPCVTVDDLFLIKNECNLSTRNTIKLSSIIRGIDIAVTSNVAQFSGGSLTYPEGANVVQPTQYCHH